MQLGCTLLTIVDLAGLEFTGKRWAAVRTSLNRAGREEMTFRMTRLADEGSALGAAMAAARAACVSAARRRRILAIFPDGSAHHTRWDRSSPRPSGVHSLTASDGAL